MNQSSGLPTTNIKIRSRHSANTQLVRPRPELDDNFEVFMSGDGYCACIHRSVLAFISLHAERMGEKETIGLLCGRVCRDPGKGPYTLVMAAGDARDGEFLSTSGDVRLLASGHARLRQRLVSVHPDREIVGWYHTHPTYPPRFSYVDVGEQNTWTDPNHIGIVYSGNSVEDPFGVYRGPDATLLRPLRREIVERRYIPPPVGLEDTAPAKPSHQTHPQPEPDLQLARPHASQASQKRKPVFAVLSWAGERKIAILTLIIIAGLCLVQASSLFWLNRRVSTVETRLHALSTAGGATERIKEGQPAQSSSTLAPTPTAVSPESTREADRVDDAELNTPAKPLSPETRSRESDTQRAASSRAKPANRRGHRNKRTEREARKAGSRVQEPSKPKERTFSRAPAKSSSKPSVRPD